VNRKSLASRLGTFSGTFLFSPPLNFWLIGLGGGKRRPLFRRKKGSFFLDRNSDQFPCGKKPLLDGRVQFRDPGETAPRGENLQRGSSWAYKGGMPTLVWGGAARQGEGSNRRGEIREIVWGFPRGGGQGQGELYRNEGKKIDADHCRGVAHKKSNSGE